VLESLRWSTSRPSDWMSANRSARCLEADPQRRRWRTSSWYLVAQNDEAIPPDAERMFAQRMEARTVEVPSSHLAMV
jgi:hypothetical protein